MKTVPDPGLFIKLGNATKQMLKIETKSTLCPV